MRNITRHKHDRNENISDRYGIARIVEKLRERRLRCSRWRELTSQDRPEQAGRSEIV